MPPKESDGWNGHCLRWRRKERDSHNQGKRHHHQGQNGEGVEDLHGLSRRQVGAPDSHTRGLTGPAWTRPTFTACGDAPEEAPLTIVPPPDPCVPQLVMALQGNLFGEPEPSGKERRSAASSPEASPELDDASLTADAQSRPRQRQASAASDTGEGPPREAASGEERAHSEGTAFNEDTADNDLPAWSHHSLVDPLQLTPMLRHYVELKAAHPERVLLYRLGDFFECFFEDAIELSRLLELTLTGKEGGKSIGRVPMAGIPHHAAERYCADLIRKGAAWPCAISWRQPRPREVPKARCSSATSHGC